MSYMPAVGDLVRHTMWSPFTDPPKTVPYGEPRIMIVKGIYEHDRGVTRYLLADPDRPNDESRYSWTESDWADVEPVAEEMGRLF